MSRESARITRILGLLEHYWRRYPDLRLAQIVGNATTGDAYNLEDDDLEAQLERWLDEPEPFVQPSTPSGDVQ